MYAAKSVVVMQLKSKCCDLFRKTTENPNNDFTEEWYCPIWCMCWKGEIDMYLQRRKSSVWFSKFISPYQFTLRKLTAWRSSDDRSEILDWKCFLSFISAHMSSVCPIMQNKFTIVICLWKQPLFKIQINSITLLPSLPHVESIQNR